MPGSYTLFDKDIRAYVEREFPEKNKTVILDVGAGYGKYRELLFDFPHMDAVEVWEPYIEEFSLADKYGRIYLNDVRELPEELFNGYSLVILGDVLEHMTTEEAQSLIDRCVSTNVLIAVPYHYHQHPVLGNPFEEHKQDDLSHEVFCERYPGFTTILRNEYYGIYYRRRDTDRQSAFIKQTELKVDWDYLRDNVYLAIATPMYGAQCTMKYLESIYKTTRVLDEKGIRHELLVVSGSVVDKARNVLVASFLHKDCTHMLFIDADQGWEPFNILRLLAMDREVIGVAARRKNTRLEWAVNFLKEPSPIERGALRVDAVGTGFLMIRRCVFEKMMAQHPELKIKPAPGEMPDDAVDKYYAFFRPELGGDQHYRSEDISFCQRWGRMGGDIWIDPQGDIVHVGSYEYRGAIESLFTKPVVKDG